MSDNKSMRKVLVSGMLGNGLEWYDYALYGQMALILSKLFFPEGDPDINLLKTYGVFALGFVARPVGAILFGYIGDKFGRRVSLALSIFMMAFPTAMIGLLPTYEQIGIWAPIALCIIRVFQGLSLGGAFSGSIAYIVEHAPDHQRGLYGSTTIISLSLGFLMGSLVSALFVTFLPPEDFESWGWRIPFLVGVVIGLVGFYIQKYCEESPCYTQAKSDGTLSTRPVRDVLTHHWPNMLRAIGIYFLVTVPFYLIAIYFISYAQDYLEQSQQDAFWMNAMCMAIFLVLSPVSGWLTDRFGRRRALLSIAILNLLVAYPIFQLFLDHSSASVWLGQALFAFFIGLYLGAVPTILVEMFPTRVRYTGMALSYNICATAFGGTAPMVGKKLIMMTGDPLSIVYYVMLCAVLASIALFTYKDRGHVPLD